MCDRIADANHVFRARAGSVQHDTVYGMLTRTAEPASRAPLRSLGGLRCGGGNQLHVGRHGNPFDHFESIEQFHRKLVTMRGRHRLTPTRADPGAVGGATKGRHVDDAARQFHGAVENVVRADPKPQEWHDPISNVLIEAEREPVASRMTLGRGDGTLGDSRVGAGRGSGLRTAWNMSSLDGLAGHPIATGGHCVGCTAGAGSSCGGALQ